MEKANEKYIVRSYAAGVFFGEIESRTDKEVKIEDEKCPLYMAMGGCGNAVAARSRRCKKAEPLQVHNDGRIAHSDGCVRDNSLHNRRNRQH